MTEADEKEFRLFAAMAMQGLVAHNVKIDGNRNYTFESNLARDSVYIAEALVAELNKRRIVDPTVT